ncbi:MAG: AsmA family protein, partial [Ahrensia sp.]
MRILSSKRFIVLLCGIIGVVLIGWLLLPVFVSTDVVRNAIERNITEITGQQVSVGDSVDISLFPTPTATLKNITIAARGRQAQATPIAVLDEIELDLALNSLITGEPRVSSVRLIRPVFNLEIDPENALSDQLPMNNVRQAVRIAGEQRDAERAQNTDLPTGLEGRPAIVYPQWLKQNIGMVSITDGSLVLTTATQDRTITITSINGALNWPRISAPLTFSGTMVVEGEALNVAYTSTHPVDALAGEVAQSTLTITSPIANLNVSGEFGFASGFFAVGDISLETPSLRRLLAWGGRPILAGRSLGALKLSAQMRARGETIRLNTLAINVDGNAGTGVLEVARRGDGPPTLVGTLDFATLDLRAFLSAFTNLPRSVNSTSSIDTSFMEQLQTDLRISANTARFDDFELTGVAATAQTTADLAL